jgi:predicted dehydrogenase
MPRLKMGMVGGGLDAMAGGLHRRAAALDGEIDFVAGALASTPERAATAARVWNVARAYSNWREMLDAEQRLPPDERIDFVVVATPNHLHATIASAFARAGFHVVCDKPMTHTLQDAKQLAAAIEQTGILFALTHNYTGYPMVKQARHVVYGGALGEILKIVVEYNQGWLLEAREQHGHKGAAWRLDPQRSGRAGAMADIGTHAENLLHYITGLQVESVCADLARHHGRALDDDGSVLLRFANNARGVLTASQVLHGEGNGLNIRVYGTLGTLEWHQERPETLAVRRNDQPTQIFSRGGAGLCPAAQRATRLPAGHPEGFNEAFANIYRNVTDTIRARKEGRRPSELEEDFPTHLDGLRGMAFVEAVVDSNASDEKWTHMARYLK